jgi:hypothetical protein
LCVQVTFEKKPITPPRLIDRPLPGIASKSIHLPQAEFSVIIGGYYHPFAEWPKRDFIAPGSRNIKNARCLHNGHFLNPTWEPLTVPECWKLACL